jgi:DnaK suppressor protein
MLMTHSEAERTQKLRQMLEERKKEIQQQIGELMAQHRHLWDDLVPDEEDLSFRNHTGESQISILEGKHLMCRQIDAALQGLKAGTYGLCVDCQHPIKEGRLKVQPYARRCLDCQADAECMQASR